MFDRHPHRVRVRAHVMALEGTCASWSLSGSRNTTSRLKWLMESMAVGHGSEVRAALRHRRNDTAGKTHGGSPSPVGHWMQQSRTTVGAGLCGHRNRSLQALTHCVRTQTVSLVKVRTFTTCNMCPCAQGHSPDTAPGVGAAEVRDSEAAPCRQSTQDTAESCERLLKPECKSE